MRPWTGVNGRIEWGYFTAAEICGYTVTCGDDPARWTLRAHVITKDGFKLTQRPLIFVAPHQRGEFRWRIEELSIAPDGLRLDARLGPLLP